VRLTVVGCSGSTSGPRSPASCYLVEHDGFRLVLDLGSGSLGALQQHLDPGLLDAVVLSHLHVDHYADLCALYVWRRYGMPAAGPALPVFGPGETAARLVAASGPLDDERLAQVFSFGRVDGAPVSVGPFTVTAARAAHPGEAYAYRIEAGGAVLAYTGDTGPSYAVTKLAAGADLLLAEASFLTGPEHPADLHLTGGQAAELAVAAGVGHLVVTHIPPWQDAAAVMAEVSAGWTGPLSQAHPGATYDVTARTP
jgi:ribonuclease BN (tRNA processing enzyme)